MNAEQITNNNEWLEIGTITAPHGLKGQLKVAPDTDFPERFEVPGQRWLKYDDRTLPQPIELLGGYQVPGKNAYVIELEGIEDRSQAEMLRGCKLLVPASDRFPLEEDEYHVSDLINLEVYDRATGENIGVVIDILWAGNDLLEIKLYEQEPIETMAESTTKTNKKSKKKKKRKRVFIPFVKEIVPVVDLEEKRIEIAPPPGLLELNDN
ncbi:MAG: ribosome maturation factor RimM [Prochloraceae cyanobacterium]|nr:ribosome maturation factor RimM [Prochloraceae cyanobacterium]